jgi:hypothetical protein
VGPCGVILFALLPLAWPRVATACQCAVPPAQEAADRSDIVFRGELVDHKGDAAVFRVREQWKGNVESFIELEWRLGDGGDCNGFSSRDLKVGNELLVFAKRGRDGIYRTSICLPTKPVEIAQRELRDLGPGKSPQKGKETPGK